MYAPVAGWGTRLPDPRGRDLPDVAVGPNGVVGVLYREPSFLALCDQDGALLRIIGQGFLNRPHGVTIGAEHIYVVDESDHCVKVVSFDGVLEARVGAGPSDPDFPPAGLHVNRIVRPHPPFTRPTRLALGPTGDLFVADGYGNARIHRFSADGRLLASWGEPGSGPGQFRIPHGIGVDRAGRVLVCDRENDRIQVFTADGELLSVWPDLQRPQAVVDAGQGRFVVAEGIRPREPIPGGGAEAGPDPSGIAILDESGHVLARVRLDPRDGSPVFAGAHSIALDATGHVYVSECLASILRGFPHLGSPRQSAVHKLEPTSDFVTAAGR